MPTPGERIATIEEQIRGIREDVTQLVAMVGDSRQPDSVRGRLHKLEGLVGSMVMRRSIGTTWLKGWERFALLAAALGTVAASWYAALGH